MSDFKQYRVTIDGVPQVTDEHGKFVPITEETGPTNNGNGQNGKDLPKEDK